MNPIFRERSRVLYTAMNNGMEPFNVFHAPQHTVFYTLHRNRSIRDVLGYAIALIFLGAFAGPAVAATESPGIQGVVAAKATRYVSEGKVDGLGIAMVRCGKPVFITEGAADRQSARKVMPDTVFPIGSISKTFTALLLAHAVADGKVNLDDDVRVHLPGQYDNLQWIDQTPTFLKKPRSERRRARRDPPSPKLRNL